MSSPLFRFLLVLSLLTVPLILSAELQGEKLIQMTPTGYKVGYQTKQGNMVLMEMVPIDQTVNNWDEMVTTQIFHGLKNTTPAEFQNTMHKMWESACEDSRFSTIKKGQKNGYPFSIWLQICPHNPATGQPEITWFKAIQGNDSFYVIQKTFRFEPSTEQGRQWLDYLKSVEVCDTRLPNSPCLQTDDKTEIKNQ